MITREAEVILFVTASAEARAERRLNELKKLGLDVHYPDVLADIRARDERDTSRSAAPLKAAPDAETIDTSGLTADEAIAAAVAAAERRLERG